MERLRRCERLRQTSWPGLLWRPTLGRGTTTGGGAKENPAGGQVETTPEEWSSLLAGGDDGAEISRVSATNFARKKVEVFY